MAVGPSVSEAFDAAYAALVGTDDNPDTGTVETTPEPAEQEAAEAPEGEEAPEGVEEVEEPEAPEGEPEGDGSDEAEDSDAEDDGADEQVVELAVGQTIRLPDGTEVPVDKAVLFQADYTRKTQELADRRRELESREQQVEALQQQVDETFNLMREWYEPRAANPAGWATEIVAESPDPTRTVARLLYDLAQARHPDGTPVLKPEFVEMFGLEQGEVAQVAAQDQTAQELAELRAWREQQERERTEQERVRTQAAQYQREWDDIKLSHGLEFTTPDAERQAKLELLQFIRQTGIDRSLIDAYDLMAARKARQAPTPPPAPAPTPVPVEKTRASQAVTPRSVAGGGPTKQTKVEPPSVRGAILDALSEMAGGH